MGRKTSSVLLAAVLVGSFAYADTLTLKDGRVLRGKVLAEFRDHLFVQIDSDPASFIKRSELTSAQGGNGEALGASTTPSPVLAVADPVGDVRLDRAGAASTAVSELAFAGERDRVVTGDSGLARLALLSGGVAKLGPSSSIVARAPTDRTDALELEQGQAFLTPSADHALDVVLTRDLRVRVTGGSAEVKREAAGVSVQTHQGTARIESPGFVVSVPTTHAVRLDVVDERTVLTAEASNAAAIEVTVGRETRAVGPGGTVVLAGSTLVTRVSGSWRLAGMKGGVSVRRTATGRFLPVDPREAEGLRVDDGDSVATDPSAEAVLARSDGAVLTVREASEVALDHAIQVVAGAARAEALHSPLVIALPAGEAVSSFATLDVRRPARGASPLELAAVDGQTRLNLPAAQALLTKGAKVRLDGRTDEAEIRASQGTLRIVTTAQPESGDPEVAINLEAPHEVTVRALHAAGVALVLEGNRMLSVGPQRAVARLEVQGDAPRLVFATGAEWTLAKELTVRVGSDQGVPLAVFPNGARVRFPEGRIRGALQPPAVLALENGTSVTARDGVQFLLGAGEGAAGAIVGTRTEDRLEVPMRNSAIASRRAELTILKLGDGRAIAIEDGAPPLQARLVAERSGGFATGPKADVEGATTLSLTMPGAAPLTLPGSRRVTVLATRQGEFVILDDPSLLDAAASRDGLHLTSSQNVGTGFSLDPTPHHLPELLGQPPPASPVK